MAIKTREEIMESLNTVLGENPSDEGLALLGDVTDTLNDYETNKQTADEIDKKWRKKYRERFFNDNNGDDDDDDDNNTVSDKPLTFESLFKEE